MGVKPQTFCGQVFEALKQDEWSAVGSNALDSSFQFYGLRWFSSKEEKKGNVRICGDEFENQIHKVPVDIEGSEIKINMV